MDWQRLDQARQNSRGIISDFRARNQSPIAPELERLKQERMAAQAEYDSMTKPPVSSSQVSVNDGNAAINLPLSGVDWKGFEFDSPMTKQMKQQEKAAQDARDFAKEQQRENQLWQEQQTLKSQQWQEAENAKSRAASGGGGGGGCFITTATLEAIDEKDGELILDEFRTFRDGWLKNAPYGNELIARYYDIAPKIVESIGNLTSVYLLIWARYLKPCRDFIRAKNNDAALNLYREMCLTLESKFL